FAIAVSGGYAVDGPKRLKGAELAIDDVNKMLEKAGAPFRCTYVHEDTGATAEGAVKVLKRFAANGIQVVIGPLSTAETKAVKPIADQNHIVVISPSSTGVAAAIPNDYIFRMPPPDVAQSKALANIIYQLGYTKVAVIARDDDYGRGLADGFAEVFQSLGGTVKKVMYQPNQPDYANEVNQLANIVQGFGADSHTAVLIIAFDKDGQNILGHAADNPVLSKVRWFGPDSMKRGSFLPPNAPEKVGEFLVKVNFTGTFPSIARNPITQQFEQEYKAKYGIDPTPYSYYAYDAVWVACLSIMAAGKYDGEAVKNVLPTVAAHFIGATGHKMLDKNGDAAFADYGIWKVVKTPDGKYEFKDIGVWKYASNQIVWKEGQG
ncbi:MAG: ABC transporter substrate-binding protein, partial [Desulfurococcales archaeon]|nr:ABC transporter substrate-binding protein [Desulfurococcales archaeon]